MAQDFVTWSPALQIRTVLSGGVIIESPSVNSIIYCPEEMLVLVSSLYLQKLIWVNQVVDV